MLEEEMEKPMKVLIVGNGAVGKSSMIQRYAIVIAIYVYLWGSYLFKCFSLPFPYALSLARPLSLSADLRTDESYAALPLRMLLCLQLVCWYETYERRRNIPVLLSLHSV